MHLFQVSHSHTHIIHRKKKQEEDLLEEDASSDTVEQSQEEGAASDLQTDTQSLHDDSDDSHDDVDLGTLGRRPLLRGTTPVSSSDLLL